MAVISVRLNSEEEKMLEYLADYYDEDKSSLIKHSLKDLYEDIVDMKVIEGFESKEKKKKPEFITGSTIVEELLKTH